MTCAQRYIVRAIIAALIVALALYLGGAFIALSWDIRLWSDDLRSTIAVTELLLGGMAGLCAGASALPERF